MLPNHGNLNLDEEDWEDDEEAAVLSEQFRSLGSFPVVTLELHTTCCDIPANLLALTIRNTRDTLQTILAEHITLSGEWEDLCSALRYHPGLHTVSLSCLKVNVKREHSIADLLGSLSTCSQLTSLKLGMEAGNPIVVTATPLSDLCALPHLKTLSLAFEAITPVWIQLCQRLHSNTTLTHLGLPAFYPAHQERSILHACAVLLRVNSTLRTLSLSYGDPSALLPIAHSLTSTNRSLQHLQLYDHARNYYYKEAIAATLVPALVHALQHNYVLESIDLSNNSSTSAASATSTTTTVAATAAGWNDGVHFQLQMNRWYRDYLLPHPLHRQPHLIVEWILLRNHHPHHLSVVFYLLSQHPTLVAAGCGGND